MATNHEKMKNSFHFSKAEKSIKTGNKRGKKKVV
jgi:hypothetical protein